MGTFGLSTVDSTYETPPHRMWGVQDITVIILRKCTRRDQKSLGFTCKALFEAFVAVAFSHVTLSDLQPLTPRLGVPGYAEQSRRMGWYCSRVRSLDFFEILPGCRHVLKELFVLVRRRSIKRRRAERKVRSLFPRLNSLHASFHTDGFIDQLAFLIGPADVSLVHIELELHHDEHTSAPKMPGAYPTPRDFWDRIASELQSLSRMDHLLLHGDQIDGQGADKILLPLCRAFPTLTTIDCAEIPVLSMNTLRAIISLRALQCLPISFSGEGVPPVVFPQLQHLSVYVRTKIDYSSFAKSIEAPLVTSLHVKLGVELFSLDHLAHSTVFEETVYRWPLLQVIEMSADTEVFQYRVLLC